MSGVQPGEGLGRNHRFAQSLSSKPVENNTTAEALPRSQSCIPGRKQLPSIPDPSGLMLGDKKMEKPTGDAGYGPFFLEYSLMAEYNLVQKQKIPGIYVIPSAKSSLVWNGVLFVRNGVYKGGVFKFKLHIPDDFPDGDCPSLIFTPSVYHPVIHPQTGQLDVQRAFHKWKRNFHHLWQVLMYAKRIFSKIETNLPLNHEAVVVFEQDPESFKTKVDQSIDRCNSLLYDDQDQDDDHAIRFSRLDPETYETTRKQMLQSKDSGSQEGPKNIRSMGLSWIAPGSSDIFNKQSHNGT